MRWRLILAAAMATTAAHAEPIPGAGDWKLENKLPGVPYKACTARIAGPQANTTLLLNNTGAPLMVLARPDWRGLSGHVDVGVSIDGGPPERLGVDFANSMMLAPILDEARLPRLRDARTLDWTLPFGVYRANIAGLGGALDAILACRKERDGI